MYNEILTIGPVTIHGYGLMIGLGVMAALLLGDYRSKKFGLNGDHIYGMTFSAVILGFVAARILFIITEWKDFLQNPMQYLAGAGFVVYGGIIGGALTIYGFCKIKKIDMLAYLDLMIPSVALAQAFGRVGCFLAGCCYGRETDSLLGVVFTNSDFAPNGVKLLPTQLFMAGGDLVIMAVLLWYAAKRPMRGRTSALYLMLYSIGRFIIEFFRNDDRGTVGMLSTSQFIAVFTLIAGVLGFFVIMPKLSQKGKTESAE
ncbi:MAG: prolipoprotein diacylglyceryl transferase [Lachnospiraceae bacterium]|nr:prolipoprotein diacylglyceryl transferase [Lachnospiraceae bacterium]